MALAKMFGAEVSVKATLYCSQWR